MRVWPTAGQNRTFLISGSATSELGTYVTKGFSEQAMNEKRYWTCPGVVVPERMPIDHILSDDPAEALKIAFAAAKRVGATLDRCQTFWRQESG